MVFAIHWHESAMDLHVFPIPIPPPPPPSSHPSGYSQCTSPEHLSQASNLAWGSVSLLIVYLFQCYSLRTYHPRLLPQSPKVSLQASSGLYHPPGLVREFFSSQKPWAQVQPTLRGYITSEPVSTGRTDAEAETLIFWPPDVTSSLNEKRPWCWERTRAEGEGGYRGQDGWMTSPTQWTWVWAHSRR